MEFQNCSFEFDMLGEVERIVSAATTSGAVIDKIVVGRFKLSKLDSLKS